MKNTWTTNQKKVITQPGSILVSASAGTGKTAVMTEKIIYLLINNLVNIENILVVTFSNASAQEMKERIRNRLYECITDSSLQPRQRKTAYRQYQNFNLANIETLHGFCKDIITKYYYKVGLKTNFSIIDANVAAVLKKDIIDEILEQEYEKKEQNFISLVEYIGDSEDLGDLIISSSDKLSEVIGKRDWLRNAIEEYNIVDNLPKKIFDMIKEDFTSVYNKYNKIINIAKKIKNPKAIKIVETINDEKTIIAAIIRDCDICNKETLTLSRLNGLNLRLSIPVDEDFFEIKELKASAKSTIDKYKKNNITTLSQINRTKEMYPIAKAYVSLCEKFTEKFQEEKKRKNVIDFSDMEMFAYDIISDNSISAIYRATINRIFIDEYQDTNPLQEKIISLISKKNNLFCVGDLKQSIYRFRSSDPLLFSNRVNEYKKDTSAGSVISLFHNFRSNKNILNCANDIFKQVSQFSEEFKYDKEEELVHKRNDDEKAFPVNVTIINSSDLSSEKELSVLSSDEIETVNIINTINSVLKQEIYDPSINGYRPVEYKDICILSRKLSGLSDIFYKFFSEQKIPFVIEKSIKLFDTIEIKNLISIFELATNIKNDIALISLIHFGLFDFNDDDLIKIRTEHSKNSIYENMTILAERNCELGNKCKNLLSFIYSIKGLDKEYSILELANYIISKTNYLDFLATLKNGKQRILNINLFKDYINEYEKNNIVSLFGFVSFIRKIESVNPTVTAKIASTNNENRVFITTIHKSKGLEFPIVILPFLGKKFNNTDKKNSVIIDNIAGIGFRYFNQEKSIKGTLLMREYVSFIQDKKNKEEELRLLYVALTRATEQLYLQGVNSCDNFLCFNAKSQFDWIMFVLQNSFNLNFYGLNYTETAVWNVTKFCPLDICELIEPAKNDFSVENFKEKYYILPKQEKHNELILTKKENKIDYTFELPVL